MMRRHVSNLRVRYIMWRTARIAARERRELVRMREFNRTLRIAKRRYAKRRAR